MRAMSGLAATSLSNVFFFNDTATTEIYTLSLHDALPFSTWAGPMMRSLNLATSMKRRSRATSCWVWVPRSEEHTSELQSRSDLVCRLLLEKKKKNRKLCLLYNKKKKQKNHAT